MTDAGPGESAVSQPTLPETSARLPEAMAGPPIPPSPGPGVAAPFPAPPTEGRGARIWLGLGAGALAIVLCCGGGVAAIIGLATVATRAMNEQAHVVVGEYFDALRQHRFDEAYALLCGDLQNGETPSEFADRVQSEPPISTYEVGDVALTSTEPMVPVRVTYATGGAGDLHVLLRQDTDTGGFEVCGVEE